MRHHQALVMGLTLLFGTPAIAGTYADDMGKCLVKSSSQQDSIDLMKWMFAAFSSNPALTELSKMTETDRTDADKKMAALTERLLTRDCRTETIDALKYEGQTAFEASFQILGSVAARTIMTDPTTDSKLQGFINYLDMSKVTQLFLDAGLSKPPAK